MKPGTFTRTPSASDATGLTGVTSPFIARIIESTPSTCAPTTRTPCDFSASATPEAKPPPPMGTMTTSGV